MCIHVNSTRVLLGTPSKLGINLYYLTATCQFRHIAAIFFLSKHIAGYKPMHILHYESYSSVFVSLESNATYFKLAIVAALLSAISPLLDNRMMYLN